MTESTYVKDNLQEKIFQVLIADSILSALLGGVPQQRIVARHIRLESGLCPFVVFNREEWTEEKMVDIRRGTYPYRFQVYGEAQDPGPLRDILNRINRILRDNEEGLSSASACVAQAYFTEGSPDLMYDEAVELYYLEGRLELVAELQNT